MGHRSVELVIGAPAWDRHWSLPLWFESVRANVDPATTGLVFVVPATDTLTREVIEDGARDFRWVEVIRDRGTPVHRSERQEDKHTNLAAVRNQVLRVALQVQPRWFLSWDTDLLVPSGTVELVAGLGLPAATVWTWLNRQAPRAIEFVNTARPRTKAEVLYQPPMHASAMRWARPGLPAHYPAETWADRARGVWECAVALGWLLMEPRAFCVAHYSPHPSSEWAPFAWRLERRGVRTRCVGDVRGVHLYERDRPDEMALGWPGVMRLSRQLPLAATFRGERTREWQAMGIFPVEPEGIPDVV